MEKIHDDLKKSFVDNEIPMRTNSNKNLNNQFTIQLNVPIQAHKNNGDEIKDPMNNDNSLSLNFEKDNISAFTPKKNPDVIFLFFL